MDHNGSSFLTCAVANSGVIYFAKERDVMVRRGTPNSAFFVLKDEDTGKFDEDVHWPAIAMATVQTAVVAIGHNGQFWELSEGVETLGKIRDAGILRNVAAIGDSLFVCGMNRAVLERTDVGTWSSIGPVVDAPGIVSFEAVAGFDEREMYAVGWHGELWWRDSGTWKRVETGTTVNLKAVTCANEVYVVGDEGVLLKGRRDQWTRVDTGVTDDLRDVAEFNGTVHLLSDSRVFELGSTSSVVDCQNFLQISATTDGLVVLSRKQLHVKRDAWTKLV